MNRSPVNQVFWSDPDVADIPDGYTMMSMNDAARSVGISTHTLREWVRRGVFDTPNDLYLWKEKHGCWVWRDEALKALTPPQDVSPRELREWKVERWKKTRPNHKRHTFVEKVKYLFDNPELITGHMQLSLKQMSLLCCVSIKTLYDWIDKDPSLVVRQDEKTYRYTWDMDRVTDTLNDWRWKHGYNHVRPSAFLDRRIDWSIPRLVEGGDGRFVVANGEGFRPLKARKARQRELIEEFEDGYLPPSKRPDPHDTRTPEEIARDQRIQKRARNLSTKLAGKQPRVRQKRGESSE